jgi:AcrR family transcriptional regulator
VPRAGLSAEVITRAAAELADRDGVAGVTLAAVARQFGVRPPSMYAHVSGERDLKQRLAMLALAELAEQVSEAIAGRSGREAIDALGRAHRAYAAAHPGRHAATTIALDDDLARASAAPRHAELSRAALRSYSLSKADETHAVRLLGATVRGWTDLELAGGFARSKPDAERSWQRAVDGLDQLFAAWGSGTGRAT